MPFVDDPTGSPDHYHCPAPTCYWRIQFGLTCSRCGGGTVRRADCCGLTRRPG